MDLDAAVTAVLTYWTRSGIHSVQTQVRMSEIVLRFSTRLQSLGLRDFAAVTPAEAAAFVTAPTRHGRHPELATQHGRRNALRTLYRTLRCLGLLANDPTLDLALPPRSLRAARPLTDDEVTLARASAPMSRGRSGLMRTVAWALGEATAVSSEITTLRVCDLDNPQAPRRVVLPGTTRHDPRLGELTDWGTAIVSARVEQLRRSGQGQQALLAYGGAAPPGGAKAQASVCNSLRDVLDAAGLAAEPDVRPGSLRHWAGRRAYDGGASIEQVARLLGHRSLDAAAQDIALTWRPEPAAVSR
ncbi:MAG: site-specific integrase [Mycobacteriales bacterium]